VHLTEIEDGRVINPLAPSHLEPYADDVRPAVNGIYLRRPGSLSTLLPHLVKGPVDMVADVSDRGGGTGMWSTMPMAPQEVSWHLSADRSAKRVIPERVAFDASSHLPPNGAFWRTYARGTWQNMPTFAGHRYWRIPGVFLYRLGTLDTRTLRDGTYTLVVHARDAGGNLASSTVTFLVWNRRELPPKTPQG
jgi:hypothetical protein